MFSVKKLISISEFILNFRKHNMFPQSKEDHTCTESQDNPSPVQICGGEPQEKDT
jgi:hypothetical protein